MQVHYVRVQKDSPDFVRVFEGIDQHIDVELSTFIFSAEPEPVISLYDFIMTTFLPAGSDVGDPLPPQPPQTVPSVGPKNIAQAGSKLQTANPDRIRLKLRLISVQRAYAFIQISKTLTHTRFTVILLDNRRVATLALSAARVTLMLQSNTMQLVLQLGNLSLTDDSEDTWDSKVHRSILSIEGDNLADLTYETFDVRVDSNKRISAALTLRSGSPKIHVLEKPLHNIYQFLVKFARLKSLYDAATEVAVQRASEIQRMQFDVTIQSPIIVFPAKIVDDQDRLVMRLGRIAARNEYNEQSSSIDASLTGISVTSESADDQSTSSLKMLDSVDINAAVNQHGYSGTPDVSRPDNLVRLTWDVI